MCVLWPLLILIVRVDSFCAFWGMFVGFCMMIASFGVVFVLNVDNSVWLMPSLSATRPTRADPIFLFHLAVVVMQPSKQLDWC